MLAAQEPSTLPADTLVAVDVVNAYGVRIVQTTWRRAGRRRDRIETETVIDATALMRRLGELVAAIAGETTGAGVTRSTRTPSGASSSRCAALPSRTILLVG
jgi:hypothetical protein